MVSEHGLPKTSLANFGLIDGQSMAEASNNEQQPLQGSKGCLSIVNAPNKSSRTSFAACRFADGFSMEDTHAGLQNGHDDSKHRGIPT